MNNIDSIENIEIKNKDKAFILNHALPYIQKYKDKTVVVKYGGSVMENPELKKSVMHNVALLSTLGIKVIVVHGGGKDITEMLKKIGKESKFINGLRYTDKETAEIVKMVLAGKVNKDLVSEDVKRMEAEKNRLLALVSSISQKKKEVEEPEREDVPNFGTNKEEEEDVPNSGTQEEKNVSNFGTEETYIPTFGRKQEQRELQREKPVFEELTASILNRYLARNEPKYISSEIRHSEDGEQLHVNINNLDYVFLFSQPAAFDISAPKKKSRALDKLLVRLNTQHPGVKFYYDEQEHRVYASGYFSNTMSPERLMEKVHEVSDCFRQK